LGINRSMLRYVPQPRDDETPLRQAIIRLAAQYGRYGDTATALLKRTVEHYRQRGIRVQRVMTDNGSPYLSTAFREACAQLGIRHLRTKPYTPRTNGKAERFIQTALREWA
jgi:transposase InsO family protein